MYVAFYAQKLLGEFGGCGPRVAGGHGIDHDDVTAIEQRVGIVFQTIGSCRHEAVRLHHHALRSERAHVQPHRGGAGAAIEREGQRTLAGVLSVKRVGDEKHFGFGLAVAALEGKPAGRRRVAERLAVQRDLVMRDNGRNFADIVMFFLVGGFVCVGLGRLGGLAAFRRSCLESRRSPALVVSCSFLERRLLCGSRRCVLLFDFAVPPQTESSAGQKRESSEFSCVVLEERNWISIIAL